MSSGRILCIKISGWSTAGKSQAIFSFPSSLKCWGAIWWLHHCYSETHVAKPPFTDGRKANNMAESMKLAPAWSTQPSETSSCAHHLILRVLAPVTILLSSLLPFTEWIRGLSSDPPAPHVIWGCWFAPFLLRWEWAPSAVEAWSSSTRVPIFGAAIWLQSDVFD